MRFKEIRGKIFKLKKRARIRMNDLIPTDKGYLVQSDSRKLFLANAELINVGCSNCIWRMHNQCPHKLKEDELYIVKEIIDVGDNSSKDKNVDVKKPIETVPICPEMIQFIISLAEKDDSITAVWEKFLIYKLRLQESEDYKDYMRLENEIKAAVKKGDLTLDKIDKLRMDKTAAKIWWTKLNQHAIFSVQKVVDREAKKDIGKKGAGIFSAKTINFNTVKQVEKKD